MTDEQLELVARLCTVAGTLMEDASAIAIVAPATDRHAAEAQVALLKNAAEHIRSLIGAAEAVLQMVGETSR